MKLVNLHSQISLSKIARFCVLLLVFPFSVFSQEQAWPSSVIEAIGSLKMQPTEISFSNSLPVENSGGHIQGIQMLRNRGTEYYVLSGSSSEYSYYTIVKTGRANIVLSVNKILDKPLKHAGGFQIWDNLMAIGVEDNEAKNKSRVFIFNIDNPEKPPVKPLTIIERVGTYKRGTAGCVAITIIDGKVLVAVGDWDTEHVDFYRIAEEKLYKEGAILELEYALDSKDLDRNNWSDKTWNSYQNINFVKDANHNLYLAGMTSIDQDENIIDVFRVESKDLSSFSFTKIYSKKFPANSQAKFRWGAGIYCSDEKIHLFATPEHINEESTIHIYE